jgi:predicted transcriptional regulator
MKNLDVLRKSGLRVRGELDVLLGVSRISVHNYLRGSTTPGVHTAPRIEKVINALSKVIDSGKLPFTPEIIADAERRAAAFSKLRAYVEAQIK